MVDWVFRDKEINIKFNNLNLQISLNRKGGVDIMVILF